MYDLIQSNRFIVVSKQEAETPTPYLAEHPELRPHIVSGEHRLFLATQAPDLVCLGGMVVYQNDEHPPESPFRNAFVPRLVRIPWLDVDAIPPETFARHDVKGVYRVIDVIVCQRTNYFARCVIDRWFGWRWLDENRLPTGGVFGVISRERLDPGVQDPLTD